MDDLAQRYPGRSFGCRAVSDASGAHKVICTLCHQPYSAKLVSGGAHFNLDSFTAHVRNGQGNKAQEKKKATEEAAKVSTQG